MQGPPGLTTLVFTDIEGSTRLWEQHGDRMSQALARHDHLSRAMVEEHRGAVVKMTGDGMYAAFADAADALSAALALQRALELPDATAGLALRVRFGLHMGIVERRDDDLFGSPVNRAARVMKAAHGGQILLSQAVASAVAARLPAQASLRDLGGVRLRDLATTEHVYQLVHPHIRTDFPALRSLEATPNNLPQQVTSFIGREHELDDIKRLLASTRLLTLMGMGGLGKTRLSLQVGADVLERYPDGVWFVDLAPINDPLLVPEVVAQVLGIREEPDKPLLQTLCEQLQDHVVLVILDNCEHLIDACASLADTLLRGTSQPRLLATSREALHIRGEQCYQVRPLAAPDRNAGVEALLRSDAVQLFVERARLQKASFTLTERDAPAVADLCARLDGIPLALELAAARMRSLSISEINTRLNDRFKLLTGGSRVALERQQTLHALVSWSYDLLQEREQLLLDRLSVFAGGFDLAAAEAICGSDPLVSDDVIDLLSSLVDKSLVMVEQSDETSRYGLLETIREFARKHLVERYGLANTVREFAKERLTDRDDLAATAARHCDYYLGVAKAAKAQLEGPDQATWTRRLEADLDNVRAAIGLALTQAVDPVLAVKFEVALMRFRILRGYSTEARNNIRRSLLLPGIVESNPARGHALYVGGVLATNQGDYVEATQMLSECLAIRRGLDTPRETAAALSTLATLHLQLDDAASAREYELEAIAIFRDVGERVGEAIGVLNLGQISLRQGDSGEAARLFEQSLALAKQIDHRELESECESNLGELALAGGDLASAQARFERSLAVCRDAEDKRGEAITLWRLGRTDAACGEMARAGQRLGDSLQALQAFEMKSEVLDCLEDYVKLMHLSGETTRSVRAFACATALRAALALPRTSQRDVEVQAQVESARAALGDQAFQAAWTAGEKWSLAHAIEQTVVAVRVLPMPA